MIRKNISTDSLRPINTPYQRPHDKLQEVVVHADDDSDQAIVRRAPSLRWRRGMFTLSVTAFTFGILMLLFSSPSIRNEVLAPGGLCSAHARILAEKGTDRCASCHPAAHQSLAGWVSTTVWGPQANQPTQSELCLKCHSQSLGDDFAMNPHSISPATLQRMTDAVASTTQSQLDSISRMPSPVYDGKVACSACHREHQGDQQSLSALTDAQCQSCHKNAFHSFELDHPEFKNFPVKRRSSIAFDHASHFGKHYPASKTEFSCAQCHPSDSGNVVQTLAPFEQACAQCHKQGIETSSAEGIALIALPTLDVDAIENQKASIGSWPMAATGDFDGPLPPLMRILLSADPQAAEVLNKKDDQFDFSDLDPDNAADVADSVTLVWAIKRLMFEMARDGEASIARRFQVVTNEDLDAERLAGLVQALDTHALRNAATRWLPDLQGEVGEQVPIYNASIELRRKFELQLARSRDAIYLGDSTERALAKVISEFAQHQNDQSREIDGSQWLAVNPLHGLKQAKDNGTGKSGDQNEADGQEAFTPVVEESQVEPLVQRPPNSPVSDTSSKNTPDPTELKLPTVKDVGAKPPANVLARENEAQEQSYNQQEWAVGTTPPQNDPSREIDGSEWLAVNPLQGLKRMGDNAKGQVDDEDAGLPGKEGNVESIVQRPSNLRSSGKPSTNTTESAQPKLPLAVDNGEKLPTKNLAPENAAIANPYIKQGEMEGSEWLVENPLAKESAHGQTQKTALVEEPKEKPTVDLGKENTSQAPVANVQVPAEVKWPTELPPIKEGWIRDDVTFQLRYQPRGHADPVLKNWIDVVSKLPQSQTASALSPAFAQLISREGVGDCRRCHTADQQDDRSLLVNWKAVYRNPDIAGFTKFAHGPHLTLPKLRDCSQCHQLETDRRTFETYESFDAGQAATNFAPMKVADCASCHQAGSVSNSCTQCHNYHVAPEAVCDR